MGWLLTIVLAGCTGQTPHDTDTDTDSDTDSPVIDEANGLYFPVSDVQTPSRRYFPLTAQADGEGTILSYTCPEGVVAFFLKAYIMDVSGVDSDDPRRIDPPFNVYPDEDYTFALFTVTPVSGECIIPTSQDVGSVVYTIKLE